MSTAPVLVTASAALPLESIPCVITRTSWFIEDARPAREARRLLREHAGRGIADGSVLDDLDVMVSELATNASLHARGPFELRVLDHAGVAIAVEFADGSPAFDRVAEVLEKAGAPVDLEVADDGALALGGRGLDIVARLSSGRCGVHRTLVGACEGKGVWFAVPGIHIHEEQGDLHT